MRFLVPVFCLFASLTNAGIVEKVISYKQDKAELEGYLAAPAGAGMHPAIIVVPDWMGVGENSKMRARMLAELGYIALVADVYGKNSRPKNTEEAGKLATSYKSNRNLMRARMKAAYDTLLMHPHVEKNKIVVMGYCFGGTAALELARSGAELKGTVTFHGGLSTPTPQDAKNIRGQVFVMHGGDDPAVPPAEVEAFEKEMRDAKVDWRVLVFGGAVHAFTIKEVGTGNSVAAYNEKADHRSWAELKNFLKEIFEE